MNAIHSNDLQALAARAPGGVVSAIQKASARTGVDFAYLMEKAAAESNFDPDIKAKTSSATGLYQFIESTWLQMVREHGDKYGLGDYAAQIDARGRVSDPAMRKEILNLRKDPEKAAMLAAEFAAGNKAYLERTWGGEVGSTELYFAHFLGAGGAAGFLKARDEQPLAAAADLFPKAAQANRNVFYDRESGRARTLAEVYDFFDQKFSGESAAPALAEAEKPGAIPLPPRKEAALAAYRPAPISDEMTAMFRPFGTPSRSSTPTLYDLLQQQAWESGASEDLLAAIGGQRSLVSMELVLLAKIQEERGS